MTYVMGSITYKARRVRRYRLIHCTHTTTTTSNMLRYTNRILSLKKLSPAPAHTLRRFAHSSDTYAKDIDPTPPKNPKVHVVNPSEDSPVSSEQATPGMQTQEYQTTSAEEPYKEKGGPKTKYGATDGPAEDNVNNRGEGPEGSDAGGRGQ